MGIEDLKKIKLCYPTLSHDSERVCVNMILIMFLGKKEEEEIRFLNRGDYFGEQALLRTDFRTANVIANSSTVECLVLDRE